MGQERIILASGSSGRRWLLEQAGYSFEVKVSQVEEPLGGYADPASFVQAVAWSKARAVAEDMGRLGRTLVIAADTIGWLDGVPLLKPDDADHARSMLTAMQGRIHELWTGVCLWDLAGSWQIHWQEKSLVRVARMSQEEIGHYLQTRIWKGCSGSYAVDGPNDPVIQILEGSLSNVVGLPMESLASRLEDWRKLAG
ncbi:MAG: Maf family protein [Gemmataceae bacterium]